MSRRSSHNSKNPNQKRAYINYIRSQEYEPTLEEGLNFEESDDKDLNFDEPTSRRKRKEPFFDKLRTHFEDNWVGWIISGVVLVMVYFMIESRVDIARLFERVDIISKSSDQLNTDIKEIKDNQHEQDLKIQENKIKTENLEKDLSQQK